MALPLVLIGLSAGGLRPLMTVLRNLPPDFPAAVLVVMHLPTNKTSSLPEVLTRAGTLPAVFVQGGERMTAGRVYVAPPDHHLTVEDGHVFPWPARPDDRFVPSVDRLFDSVDVALHGYVVGVILSGLMDDGAQSLVQLVKRGGIAVVQTPEEAAFEEMPRKALITTPGAWIVNAAVMGTLLNQLITTSGALGQLNWGNETEESPA